MTDIDDQMAEAVEVEKPKKRTRKPKAKSFMNVTTENIFTQTGRVGPGQATALTGENVKDYPGLEPCET